MESKIQIRQSLLTFCLSLAFLLPPPAAGAITNCLVEKDKTAHYSPCTPEEIAEALGWVPEPFGPICRGSFQNEPLPVFKTPQSNQIQIQADQVSLFNASQSTVSGNVVVDQPGKQLRADRAIIDRNPKTGDVTHIQLKGHIMLREPGQLLIGQEADFDQRTQIGNLNNVLYRAQTKRQPDPWGRAFQVHRDANRNYTLKSATYSTCPPLDETWHIDAKELFLDKKASKGTAKHTILYAGKIPVVYIPYFNFPLDNERKSGLLLPTIGYNNRTGADITIPVYLNIAPNLDSTIAARYLSQRGVMVEDEIRYLTEHTQGTLYGTYLHHDLRFLGFKEENDIPGTGTDRGMFYWKNQAVLNANWQSSIDYNTVSDDNYFQDFGETLAQTTQNQLLQMANLRYTDEHWFFLSGVQSYQTLNPVNQPTVSKIYNRLPQVILNGNFPDLAGPMSFYIENEFDNFEEGPPSPDGYRASTNPVMTLHWNKPAYYAISTVDWHSTWYHVDNDSRQIPRFSLDLGSVFERETAVFGTDYVQTLEPRLYYLLVPYSNQSTIPIYDTTPYVFNFDQLFRRNRYAGLDRIGDANQLTFALTSRWLNEDSGNEQLHWGIGTIVYFTDRKVQFCEGVGCTESPYLSGYQSPTSATSPLMFQLEYHINHDWSLMGNLAWDLQTADTNNANAHLHYQPDRQHIFDVGYSYLVNGDPDPRGQTAVDAHNDLHQFQLGVAEPLNDEWSMVGQWGYNIAQNYSLSYYLGAQYDSCCWAFRVLGGKLYSNFNSEFRPEYQSTVMLQLVLKGLGAVGNRSPVKTISTLIPGYRESNH